MGRIVIPKYRLRVRDIRGWSTLAWHGRITNTRLAKWIHSYEESLEEGGVNEHISKMLGYVPYVLEAVVVRQKDNKEMLCWKKGEAGVK